MLFAEISPVTLTIGVALALLIGGLVIVLLSKKALDPGTIATVVWWLGMLCVVLGALFMVTPILIWITKQLGDAMGIGHGGP